MGDFSWRGESLKCQCLVPGHQWTKYLGTDTDPGTHSLSRRTQKANGEGPRKSWGGGKRDKKQKDGRSSICLSSEDGGPHPSIQRPSIRRGTQQGPDPLSFWSWVPREIFKVAPSCPLARTWGRGRLSLRAVSFLYPTSDLIPGTPELGMGLSQKRLLSGEG